MATNGSMCLDDKKKKKKKKKRSRTVVAAERSRRSKKVAADRSKSPRLSKAELEIKKEILNEKIAELREDIESLEDLKQVLIIRIRQQNDELEEARKILIQEFGENLGVAALARRLITKCLPTNATTTWKKSGEKWNKGLAA